MNIPVILGAIIAVTMLAALGVMLFDAFRAPPSPDDVDAARTPPKDENS
jgi:hypothetical protein